jgi:hypothetical protein
VALVWLAQEVSPNEELILAGKRVTGITPLLTPASQTSGTAHQLAENEDRAFIGSYVLGSGFWLDPEQAHSLIKKDARNKDVLFPYLNGDDLNQRTRSAARRWIINFHDWPMERAAEYADVYAIVEREVKPFREKNNRKVYREYWWQYAEKRPAMLAATADLKQVIAIGLTSSTQLPALLPRTAVLDQTLVIFSTDSYAELAFRSSEFQFWWTVQYGPTRTGDLRYTPSTCCAPLPVPEFNDELEKLGTEMETLQQSTGLALTPLSQRIHSPGESAPSIIALREVHRRINLAVLAAYGWDLALDYGFHETRRGTRYTMSPNAQSEVLDLLLQLNHARYADEVQQGLHTPEAKKRRAAARKAKAKARAAARTAQSTSAPETFDDGGLFPEPDALF